MTGKSEKKEKKAAEQPDPVEELQKKLDEAESKAGEYLQMAQRLQADFDIWFMFSLMFNFLFFALRHCEEERRSNLG